MSGAGSGRHGAATPRAKPRRELCAEVRDYLNRGWRLIPLEMEEKKPSVRWRRYQTTAPSANTIRRWFVENRYGVAVIFGEPSGGLVSRDFDTMESYDRWAKAHSELAASLPTVATRRGRHVYARADAENVAALRQQLGRPVSATGALKAEDGELRAGRGCYSVLPPSVHPSGHRYEWIVPLPDGPLPLVDLLKCGFIEIHQCDREHRDNGGILKGTEAITVAEVVEGGQKQPLAEPPQTVIDWDEEIENAILSSLPTAAGQRHEQVFRLARTLKAIPAYAEADARSLKGLVAHFHQLALPHIRTKPFEETWVDFLRAWPNVRFPLGQEPIAEIVRQADNSPLPQVASRFEQPGLKRLVAICRELQRSAGSGPFYLSCRTAGRLLGVDHSTANRWLFLLSQEGITQEIEKGSRSSGRASRYRYCSPL